MSELQKIKRKYEEYLMGIKGVTGIGVANQHIVILVEKITPELRAVLPRTLDGVPVKVIEVGRVRLFLDTTDRWRPAPGGVSLGHPKVTAGTFACVVSRGSEIFGLSNNHVIALNWGYSRVGKRGDPTLQPGPYDGGTEKDAIGELYDWVPVEFNKMNKVDCAIFKPYRDMVRPEILEVGIPTGSGLPKVGMKVKKFGRSCHLAYSKIEAIDVTVKVYGFGVCTFTEQFIVRNPFGIPGDSGSAVLDNENRVVGLLFAGSWTHTVCNYAVNVERELGIKFAVPSDLIDLRNYAIGIATSIAPIIGAVIGGWKFVPERK